LLQQRHAYLRATFKEKNSLNSNKHQLLSYLGLTFHVKTVALSLVIAANKTPYIYL
jgi:hypothetical protein